MNRPLSERPRSYLRRVALVAAAIASLAASSCAGPPVPSEVTGEPVCADYEVGAVRTKMQGSLRFPVMLTILDGSTVVLKSMILGRRSEKDPVKRILLVDSNEEYEVQWAQCENERAPRPVTGGADSKEALRYECGKEEVYAKGKLETKKGDLATHALAFLPPPRAECWMSDVPTTADADAGAPADASAPEAGALEADAGDVADAGGGTDGGTDAGEAAATDAGSTDAGSADAAAPTATDGGAETDGGAAKKKKKPAAGAAPPGPAPAPASE